MAASFGLVALLIQALLYWSSLEEHNSPSNTVVQKAETGFDDSKGIYCKNLVRFMFGS